MDNCEEIRSLGDSLDFHIDEANSIVITVADVPKIDTQFEVKCLLTGAIRDIAEHYIIFANRQRIFEVFQDFRYCL